MQVTIDKAGRVVIPKSVRDSLGLSPGTGLALVVDGLAIRLQPEARGRLVEQDGFLVIASTGTPITDDLIADLRRAGQR